MDFYSQFIILKDIVSKFVVEDCPEELSETCKEYTKIMEHNVQRVDECNEKFITMLIETDKKMESLSKNFSSIKPDNIRRVVMNSILILNKENFYTQLNSVLEKKNDELILAKVKD